MCDVDHTHVGVKVRALDDAPLNDYLSAGPINTNGSATPQVFAWDTSKNAPDEDEDDGRSYISAVSEVITDSSEKCNGRAKNEMGEARMDIEDSEMAYLGFHDGESYGLTWKVGGEHITTFAGREMCFYGTVVRWTLAWSSLDYTFQEWIICAVCFLKL